MHEDNRRDIDHLARERTSEPASELVVGSVCLCVCVGGVTRRIGYTLFRRVLAAVAFASVLHHRLDVAAAKLC